jgi:hypothetical protein
MPVRPALAALPLLAVAGLVLAGCSSEPQFSGATPAEFATTACTAFADLYAAEQAAPDVLETVAGQDGETQKATILAQLDEHLAQLATWSDDIAAVQPAVETGPEITAAFTDYFDLRIADATVLVDGFREVPTELGPNGDDVVVAAIDVVYGTTESGMAETPEFPFAEIEDQDVVSAIDEEPACADVVAVY